MAPSLSCDLMATNDFDFIRKLTTFITFHPDFKALLRETMSRVPTTSPEEITFGRRPREKFQTVAMKDTPSRSGKRRLSAKRLHSQS